MNKFKAVVLGLALLSSQAVANDTYGDWTYNEDLESYTSPDLINHKLHAMLSVRSSKVLRFGFFLPYEQCYLNEEYSEPFGQVWILGANQDFSLKCLGKSKAVVYSSNYIDPEIISSLIKNGNICMTVQDSKFCFSGNGVKELQELAKNKS